MAKRSKEDRIKAAIHSHERYKNSWSQRRDLLYPTYISPKGKSCTYHEYNSAVNKHLNATVKKILAIANDVVELKVQ
ncbi:hypothetical protein pf16_235 [Pseudomonas phage pf16]|uniref:Uncharacterized protein n=1 Tax=Pseudomonas phage pf16 TaxID=1815630 RepID=A0A1S5R415_9CAUD|nr:hypothetical protein FDG98_gp063 [Pseudomonas phage pf16]AND75158.1 hypothetical protein pf16_235 [Pseudomonas phage pf16]